MKPDENLAAIGRPDAADPQGRMRIESATTTALRGSMAKAMSRLTSFHSHPVWRPRRPLLVPEKPSTFLMVGKKRQKSDEDIASIDGLGKAVRAVREKRRLTPAQVAERAGLDFTTINGVERGAWEMTWGNLRRLAKGLDVELDALIELAEALAPGEGGERWRLSSWVAEREGGVG